MSSRREALKRLTQASALGLVAAPLLNNLLAQGRTVSGHPDAAVRPDLDASGLAIKRCGVQLYTIRGEMEKSVEAALARVASIGFKEVEFAGYFNRTPAQIAATLKSNGLTAPSVHIPVTLLMKDLNANLDAFSTIGHKYAVMPWVDPKERTSIEFYKKLADQCNEAGAACRKRGIQFAYHNHEFEFERLNGEIPYDVLLSRCDKDLVKFEMDLFWTNHAGRDPLEYFARHPGRFPLVHVKDRMADGTMTEVGSGKIPFASYIAKASQAGIVHYFVEHDNPKDPYASITTSFRALSAL